MCNFSMLYFYLFLINILTRFFFRLTCCDHHSNSCSKTRQSWTCVRKWCTIVSFRYLSTSPKLSPQPKLLNAVFKWLQTWLSNLSVSHLKLPFIFNVSNKNIKFYFIYLYFCHNNTFYNKMIKNHYKTVTNHYKEWSCRRHKKIESYHLFYNMASGKDISSPIDEFFYFSLFFTIFHQLCYPWHVILFCCASTCCIGVAR